MMLCAVSRWVEDETPEVNLQSGFNLLPLAGVMPAHGSCADDWISAPNEPPSY